MSRIVDTIHKTKPFLRKFLSKDAALFLFFLVMATAFWFLLTFNTQMTRDVLVKLKVKKPNNVTLLHELPEMLTVTVKDRGTAFLNSYFHSNPSIEIDFSKYLDEKSNSLSITSSQLLNELRHAFRREATIIKTSPDSIKVKYTLLPGKKVSVNWEENVKNITTDRQFVINPEEVHTNPDSVMIYALDKSTLNKINEVDIATVEIDNLTASLDKTVRIKSIPNVRIIPNKVKLHISVEPLIMKQVMVPISVRNIPYGLNVLLFPPSVKVSFLLPQSKYKSPVNLTVVADYNDINLAYNYVKIKEGEVDGSYMGIQLETDSVRYILERF